MGFVGVNRKGGTKFQFSKERLRKLVGEAAAQALQKAGLLARRVTQRGMVGGSNKTGRSMPKKPTLRVYGTKDGRPVIGAIYGIPRQDRVSSWAPMAFLRNDIQSDYDFGTKSVVIGPSKVPWLNQLHETGGTANFYVASPKYPRTQYAGKNLPRSMLGYGARGRKGSGMPGSYVGYVTNKPVTDAIPIGSRTLRGRRYMENGFQAYKSKIPEQFRNSIRSSGVLI